LVVIGESLILAARPGPRVVERPVVIRQPLSSPSATSPAPALPAPERAQPGPAPVVLLGPPAEPSNPSSDVTPVSPWETVSDSRRLQELVLRFGLDAWPEPARRLTESGQPLETRETTPVSAGALRRLELEKLQDPGDRS
jgi:hypothetical protein